MSDETGDDAFKNFAKAVEDLLENLQPGGNTRFVGCTIISDPNSEQPAVSRDMPPYERIKLDSHEVEYEIMEGEDVVYLTVEVPFEIGKMPKIDVSERSVRICLELLEYQIDLPCAVLGYGFKKSLKNGILDIVCRKMPSEFEEEGCIEPID